MHNLEIPVVTMKVGFVGCGSIANTYIQNAPIFPGFEFVACSDIDMQAAVTFAEKYGLVVTSYEEILANTNIDVVINLTPPAAHYAVSSAALKAKKHVYSEKPLALSIEQGLKLKLLSQENGRLLACAPDTFLGAAGQMARQLVDRGVLGTVVSGTAFNFSHGMEHWHSNPEFFYKSGGGPVMDMGPYFLTQLVQLLGPVVEVSAVAGENTGPRKITAKGPKSGTTFVPEVATSILTLLRFESGPVVTFGASWDVHNHKLPFIELHGSNASMTLPNPDNFGGNIVVGRFPGEEEHHDLEKVLFGQSNWPPQQNKFANYRGAGLADLCSAAQTGRNPRCSLDLSLHVLDIMVSAQDAAETRRWVPVRNSVARPEPLQPDEPWIDASYFLRT